MFQVRAGARLFAPSASLRTASMEARRPFAQRVRLEVCAVAGIERADLRKQRRDRVCGSAQALCGHGVGIYFLFSNRGELHVGHSLFFEAFQQHVLIVTQPQLTGQCRRRSVGRDLVMFEPLY